MMVPDSYYSGLVQNQNVAIVPIFVLESGTILTNVPVAYSTWGELNETGDNALVVCHALTGSSDASDWWHPLIGPGRALDSGRYFIFCANVLGSPYGSASPLSIDPVTNRRYGPTFPETTIRDDVRIHKLVLDTIGVQSIAAVIGGSMGGMHTLEWPLSTPSGFVKNIVPIATSAYQGAWGISWGETQRQAICTDSTFNEGWYEPVPRSQPRAGLGVARMIGMLTYRSFDSFEARFGRRVGLPMKRTVNIDVLPTPPLSDAGSTTEDLEDTFLSPRYSTQSYLQYQADKFLNRFDANCYLHLLKKMNTHDVTRGRHCSEGLNQTPTVESLKSSLSTLPEGTTVIGVQTDLLFPLQQQIQLAQCLPDARYVALQSTDGHDGFLLDFDTLNGVITEHLRKRCSWVYEGDARTSDILQEAIVVDSVFGELENAEC